VEMMVVGIVVLVAMLEAILVMVVCRRHQYL
jgi:hypothetical protein